MDFRFGVDRFIDCHETFECIKCFDSMRDNCFYEYEAGTFNYNTMLILKRGDKFTVLCGELERDGNEYIFELSDNVKEPVWLSIEEVNPHICETLSEKYGFHAQLHFLLMETNDTSYHSLGNVDVSEL